MTHDEIWHLLPWFVNGRLESDVRATVDTHIAACANCRAEVEQQKQLHGALVREEPVPTSAQASFDQLWSRISAEAPSKSANAPAALARRAAPGGLVRWLAAAAIVEAVALGTLAVFGSAAQQRAPAIYQTLSAPAAHRSAPSIRAVFVSDVTLRDLQGLLARLQLRIVDGPTEAGVYTLAIDDAQRSIEATLADLRGNMFVRFAEPIGSGLAKR